MFFQTQEIQKEYRRLDGICGLDTTYMPIKRYRQKGKTVAMCEFTSTAPSQSSSCSTSIIWTGCQRQTA